MHLDPRSSTPVPRARTPLHAHERAMTPLPVAAAVSNSSMMNMFAAAGQ
jgi:hypothetical protein